jgi:3-oxoacyl-[acyl-carrier-protein] synthase II
MAKLKDHLGRPVVAVTGIGMVTSLGKGKADNWAALIAGKSGIHPITRFPVDQLNTRISGMVDFLDASTKGASALTYELAETAAVEAIAESGLSPDDFGGPLFLASPPVEVDWHDRLALYRAGSAEDAGERLLEAARNRNSTDVFETAQFGTIADRLADRFGAVGLPITLSTACASGATAIQLGVEAIRRGECDHALAVGADGSATAEALIRFSLLSALSTSNESPEKASKPFSKDRDGFVLAEGSAALVLESLEAAQARGATVLGILRGCGEKADDFHRTRSKPDGSPAIALDVVPNVKREAAVRTVLSNSFGFGGQNTCLVMAREPV